MSSSPIIPALFDAVVPAAGVGKRMGAQVPKQYLKLTAERTILEATVEKLLACPFIEHIIIAVSPDAFLEPVLPVIGSLSNRLAACIYQHSFDSCRTEFNS